jgi:hypothetical protein
MPIDSTPPPASGQLPSPSFDERQQQRKDARLAQEPATQALREWERHREELFRVLNDGYRPHAAPDDPYQGTPYVAQYLARLRQALGEHRETILHHLPLRPDDPVWLEAVHLLRQPDPVQAARHLRKLGEEDTGLAGGVVTLLTLGQYSELGQELLRQWDKSNPRPVPNKPATLEWNPAAPPSPAMLPTLPAAITPPTQEHKPAAQAAVLPSTLAPNPKPLNKTEKKILAKCRRKAWKGQRLANEVDLSFDYVRRVCAKLVKLGHLRNTDAGYRTVRVHPP